MWCTNANDMDEIKQNVMEQNVSKYDEIITKNRMRIGTEIEIEIRTKI